MAASIDRQLREMVFGDQQARKDLESILHPRIRQTMRQQLEALNAPYAILSIPLLLGDRPDGYGRSGAGRGLHGRGSNRTGLYTRPGRIGKVSALFWRPRAAATEKLRIADDVIDNSGPQEALIPQVEALHRRYLEQSGRTDIV